MNIRKIAAVLAAALTVATAAPSAMADYDYGYDQGYDYNYDDNYDYGYGYDYDYDNGYDDWGQTTTTAPITEYDPAQSAGNEVTSVDNAVTTLAPDKPTSAPSKVYLQYGEVSNDSIPVDLMIESDEVISNALISVSFDTSIFELVSTQINDEAGGKAVENNFNGKYVFNYTNESGSRYQGKYVTLNLKLLDKGSGTSTIFVAVTSLDNTSGIPISYSAENCIVVTDPDAAGYQPVDSEATKPNKKLNLVVSKGQVLPADLGIENFRNIVSADSGVISYEGGVIKILAAGQTTMDVVFNNNELETYDVTVTDDTIVTDAEDVVAPVQEESESPDNSKRNLFIMIALLVGVLALIIEYIVIMKPLERRNKKLAAAEKFFENEEDEEEKERRDDLKKAFAARDARRKAESEEEDISFAEEDSDDEEDDTDEENDAADDEEDISDAEEAVEEDDE